MTCDDATDVCPGTELTCTCSVSDSLGLVWRLQWSVSITFDDKADVGSNETTTDGAFFAVVTNKTEGVLESMLIFTATASLVDGIIIDCTEEGTAQSEVASVTITAG